MTGTFGALYLGLVLLGLVIAVLWICLPFAVFGMKPLMHRILEEQQHTNRLLLEIRDHVARQAAATSAPPRNE